MAVVWSSMIASNRALASSSNATAAGADGGVAPTEVVHHARVSWSAARTRRSIVRTCPGIRRATGTARRFVEREGRSRAEPEHPLLGGGAVGARGEVAQEPGQVRVERGAAEEHGLEALRGVRGHGGEGGREDPLGVVGAA